MDQTDSLFENLRSASITITITTINRKRNTELTVCNYEYKSCKEQSSSIY